MFITKSEKESLVETSLNLGNKAIKNEKEIDAIKTILKKSPSYAWVHNLEQRLIVLEKRIIALENGNVNFKKSYQKSLDVQAEKNKDLFNIAYAAESCVESNRKLIHNLFAGLMPEPNPEPIPVVVKKKRGRPLGSKAKRPLFPPKTPFELLKPLGRPKGSKNKPK